MFPDQQRRTRKKSSGMLAKVLLRTIIERDIRSSKCSFEPKKCIEHFTITELKDLRMSYWSKDVYQRSIWLTETIGNARKLKRTDVYQIKGYQICYKCLMTVYHISKNKYFKQLHHVRRGSVAPGLEGEVKRRSHSDGFVEAMTWFELYITCHGDRMPHTNDIFLPYKTKKSKVWLQYVGESAEPRIAKTTFIQMWRQNYPHVKVKVVGIICYRNIEPFTT